MASERPSGGDTQSTDGGVTKEGKGEAVGAAREESRHQHTEKEIKGGKTDTPGASMTRLYLPLNGTVLLPLGEMSAEGLLECLRRHSSRRRKASSRRLSLEGSVGAEAAEAGADTLEEQPMVKEAACSCGWCARVFGKIPPGCSSKKDAHPGRSRRGSRDSSGGIQSPSHREASLLLVAPLQDLGSGGGEGGDEDEKDSPLKIAIDNTRPAGAACRASLFSPLWGKQRGRGRGDAKTNCRVNLFSSLFLFLKFFAVIFCPAPAAHWNSCSPGAKWCVESFEFFFWHLEFWLDLASLGSLFFACRCSDRKNESRVAGEGT